MCTSLPIYMCKCVLQDLPDGTHINKENLQATLLEAGHTCCAESGTIFPRLGTLYIHPNPSAGQLCNQVVEEMSGS